MDIINDFEVQFYKALRLLDFGKTEQASKIKLNKTKLRALQKITQIGSSKAVFQYFL